MWKFPSAESRKKWREILSILGPLFGKHFNNITKNLEALNWNLKLGFLWDHGPKISVEKLSVLVRELKNAELLSQDIYVISVGFDLILVNVPKFLLTYKSLNELHELGNIFDAPGGSEPFLHETTKFIDVSKNINFPKLIKAGTKNYGTILEMLKSVLESFEEYQNLPSTSKSCLTLKTETSWCIPTLFGLLIGYPVIYWYDGDQDTCCVALQVYKLVAENQFALYSFSVPYNLVPRVHSYLEEWCKNMINDASKSGSYFRNMQLVVRNVAMNTVIL